MNDSFNRYVEQCQQRINDQLPDLLGAALSEYTDDPSDHLNHLFSAMRYSLLNGGKRVRPLLVYAAAEAIDPASAEQTELDRVAAAVECIHAYSLVHDDLPAMDDDTLRRGQPTCHIAYDEATAILVGDALQSRAYELLTTLNDCTAERSLRLVAMLSAAAGPRGMVGGQMLDLLAVNQTIDRQHLQTIHQLKTGALIRAATGMGAIYAGASSEQLLALDQYARAIGLSFQVQDDILDVESSTDTLGKTQGADQARNKPTYPALLGMEGAKSYARELHEKALACLEHLPGQAIWLGQLSEYIITRKH